MYAFVSDLFFRLKALYPSLGDFDSVAIDEYNTKLQACMDPNVCYDGLRSALLQPTAESALTVVGIICNMCEERDGNEEFRTIAYNRVATVRIGSN